MHSNYLCEGFMKKIGLILLSLIFFPIFIIAEDNIGKDKDMKETGKKVVYFIQGHWENFFFDQSSKEMAREHGYNLEPLFKLHKVAAEAGYDLRVAARDPSTLTDITGKPIEDFEYIIVFDIFGNQLSYLPTYPKEKLILIAWEPPTVKPENYYSANHALFSKVYTWNDDLVDNKKFFKIFYPALLPMIPDPVDFDLKKNLSTLIASNMESMGLSEPNELYSERNRLINFYETYHGDDFDLYGKWWTSIHTTYKGPISSKVDVLKNYKFYFAYENTRAIPGYVSEKIFDSFQAGTIPIYLGAPNITKYVPKNCFISREAFDNDEELYQFLKNMPKEQYQAYIKNIQAFLISEQAQLFSPDNFVKIMMDLITTPPVPDSVTTN
jgi:hypothetical protein